MGNKRLRYKKIIDIALMISSFLFFCAGAFLGGGSGLCVLVVMMYIVMFLFFSYEEFNKWVNKGEKK